MNKHLITAALIACVTMPAFGQSIPKYCGPGPGQCTHWDMALDRRDQERKAATELDRRESLRDEQAQWDRSADQLERQWNRMQDRRDREAR